jgi:hypothetical protein
MGNWRKTVKMLFHVIPSSGGKLQKFSALEPDEVDLQMLQHRNRHIKKNDRSFIWSKWLNSHLSHYEAKWKMIPHDIRRSEQI